MVIKIDRKSIRLNPDAGRTTYHFPGKWSDDGKGGRFREIQTVYSMMMPEPAYLYSYEQAIIECNNCHEKFDIKELLTDSYYDAEGDYYSDKICPKCNTWECCDIEYEEFSKELMEI